MRPSGFSRCVLYIILSERNVAAEYSRAPGPRLVIPVFMGHGDVKSVAHLLLELDSYRVESGYIAACLLRAAIPVALKGCAAWASQADLPFVSWEDFKNHFRAEFLPVHYEIRIMDEPRWQTRHPNESVIKYICSMQELICLPRSALIHITSLCQFSESIQKALKKCSTTNAQKQQLGNVSQPFSVMFTE